MTDVERAHYDNLILLCVQHHDETNDVDKYPVLVLKEMKQQHVSKNLGDKVKSNPSMIRNTINAIADLDIDGEIDESELDSFNINSKLTYNSVKKYAPLIQEYKVYHHKINSLYDELESQGSLKKNKVLYNIRRYYVKAKGKYTKDSQAPIDSVRDHADDIIDDVLQSLYSEMAGSGTYHEGIILGVDLIVVDAFMRCKILEKPK